MEDTTISVFKKIQTRGVSWFLARLLQESENGISVFGRMLKPIMLIVYWSILYPINKLISLLSQKRIFDKDTLYLFYDLNISPVTFDFAWALVLAEKQRKKSGFKKLQVIFVPGKYNGLREESPDYEACVDLFARYWRRNEILYAICNLLPECVGVIFCSTREEASALCEEVRPNIFPKRYSTTFPITHSTSHALSEGSNNMMPLRSTKQAKRYIQQWLDVHAENKKLITVTLRNSSYMPARNSNISAWAAFAKKLDSKEYFVVFVPDTDNSLSPPPQELSDFTFFTEPSWNLNLRAALYEMSHLNLGLNNGVMALCWLNAKCRYISFKMMVPEAPQATEAALKTHGFEIGKSLPFANSLQKWVWETDDADVIEREFNYMCALIDQHTAELNHG